MISRIQDKTNADLDPFQSELKIHRDVLDGPATNYPESAMLQGTIADFALTAAGTVADLTHAGIVAEEFEQPRFRQSPAVIKIQEDADPSVKSVKSKESVVPVSLLGSQRHRTQAGVLSQSQELRYR